MIASSFYRPFRVLGLSRPLQSSPTDETIAELIEEIAQSLMWYGRAFYYLHDDDGNDETHIVSYSSESIFRFTGKIVQYHPSGIERNWDREDVAVDRELRMLDARKTLRFQWPASIRRKIAAQYKVLATPDKYDGSVGLKFHPQVTHENPNPRSYFDFE